MKRSPLLLIWITVFVDLVGFGIVIPFLARYAEMHGATPFQAGLLMASYSSMQFVFAPILGALSDRVGRKPVLAVSMFGTALATLALGIASTMPTALWLLFVARIVDGITGGNVSTAHAYVADVTPPDKRARGMGLLGMAFGLGFVLGPAIGGLLADAFGIAAPFYAVAAVAAANATAMLFFLPEPERHVSAEEEAKVRFAGIAASLRDPRTRTLIVTFLLAAVAFASMESTLAFLLTHHYGFRDAKVGYVFAYVGVVMAVVQGGLIGKLVDRFGERTLVSVGVWTLAVALALLALPLPPSLPLLFGALALLAVGSGLNTPAATGLISRLTPASSQGATLGVTQSMGSIGRILGPLAATALYQHGWALPYWFGASVMAVAGLLLVFSAGTLGERRAGLEAPEARG